ncbi:hypothetical protein [Bradyrhizobium sp. F1.13.3]|uniref:hypothetical protein n=1 Tax=Bradyrhizobium sp. F1.13.3 TaxID=3156351 RepID=UPI00339AAA91
MDAWQEKSNSDAAGGLSQTEPPYMSVFDHRTRPGDNLEHRKDKCFARKSRALRASLSNLSLTPLAEKLHPSHSPVSGSPPAPVSNGNRSDFAGMVARIWLEKEMAMMSPRLMSVLGSMVAVERMFWKLRELIDGDGSISPDVRETLHVMLDAKLLSAKDKIMSDARAAIDATPDLPQAVRDRAFMSLDLAMKMLMTSEPPRTQDPLSGVDICNANRRMH